jgi:hypothetical protein
MTRGSAMAKWTKCSDSKGQPVWVNLDNATIIARRDGADQETEIVFIGGGLVVVREKPEELAAR